MATSSECKHGPGFNAGKNASPGSVGQLQFLGFHHSTKQYIPETSHSGFPAGAPYSPFGPCHPSQVSLRPRAGTGLSSANQYATKPLGLGSMASPIEASTALASSMCMGGTRWAPGHYNQVTGAEQWSVMLDGSMWGSPTIDSRIVYLSPRGRAMSRAEADTRARRCGPKQPAPRGIYTAPPLCRQWPRPVPPRMAPCRP